MKTLEQLEKELEELEQREFMVQMIDRWSSEDYRHADELHRLIREKEKEIELCKQNSK